MSEELLTRWLELTGTRVRLSLPPAVCPVGLGPGWRGSRTRVHLCGFRSRIQMRQDEMGEEARFLCAWFFKKSDTPDDLPLV